MKSDWPTTASFERTHAIVSAINTLSIHAKLTLVSITDPTDVAEIQQARARPLTFLDEFDALLKGPEGSRGGAWQVNLTSPERYTAWETEKIQQLLGDHPIVEAQVLTQKLRG